MGFPGHAELGWPQRRVLFPFLSQQSPRHLIHTHSENAWTGNREKHVPHSSPKFWTAGFVLLLSSLLGQKSSARTLHGFWAWVWGSFRERKSNSSSIPVQPPSALCLLGYWNFLIGFWNSHKCILVYTPHIISLHTSYISVKFLPKYFSHFDVWRWYIFLISILDCLLLVSINIIFCILNIYFITVELAY